MTQKMDNQGHRTQIIDRYVGNGLTLDELEVGRAPTDPLVFDDAYNDVYFQPFFQTNPYTLSRWLEEAVAVFDNVTEGPHVVVGSSMGVHVATAAAEPVGAIGLFVLAPAYYMEGFEGLTPAPPPLPTTIVHGWHDDIVPPENSIRFARACGATLHLLDGDHRLTANIDEINAFLEYFVRRVTGSG